MSKGHQTSFEVYIREQLFWQYSFDKDEIRIGRVNDCDIILPVKSVSRLHALVERNGDSYSLTDKSTNGTFVEGERIDKVPLNDGDRFQIEHYFIVFSKR